MTSVAPPLLIGKGMKMGGGESTRAAKKKKKLARAKYTHVSRQERNRSHHKLAHRHAKAMSRRDQKEYKHHKEKAEESDRHRTELHRIRNDRQLNPEQRRRALIDENARHAKTRDEHVKRDQRYLEKRDEIHQRTRRDQREIERRYQRHKNAAYYMQQRYPQGFLAIGGGSAGYIPASGIASGAYETTGGGSGGGVGYGSDGSGYAPMENGGSDSRSDAHPNFDGSEREKTKIGNDDGDDGDDGNGDDNDNERAETSAPSARPLPNPSEIAILRSLDVNVAKHLLLLREAFDLARTLDDYYVASVNFCTWCDRVDKTFHTHTSIYKEVMKQRPATWSIAKAETFVDQLDNDDDIAHLASLKDEAMRAYLLSL